MPNCAAICCCVCGAAPFRPYRKVKICCSRSGRAGNQLAQLSGGIPQFAVFFHCGQVGQNIRQGQHAAVRAGFQRLLQRNGACFAPGVAQLHPQLVSMQRLA